MHRLTAGLHHDNYGQHDGGQGKHIIGPEADKGHMAVKAPKRQADDPTEELKDTANDGADNSKNNPYYATHSAQYQADDGKRKGDGKYYQY